MFRGFRVLFYLAPDDAGSGAAAGGGAAPASPGASPAAGASAPPAPSPSTPAGSATAPSAAVPSPGAAPSSPAAQPTPGEFVSIRDAARGYGLDLTGQFQDDHAALQHLIMGFQRGQQANQLAQYGQLYLQHAPQFQEFLRQQQAQQQQQQAQQNTWWKPPQWDPSWRSKVARDPTTGQLVPAAGGSPEIVANFQRAMDHREGFLERFAFDPIGAIKPGIEQVAREIAQQMVQQHLAGYQERSHAQSFVEKNADWLFVPNPMGFGQRQLSPAGQLFQRYVQEAEQMGLTRAEQQQTYAMRMLERDQLRQQHGNPPPQPAAPAQADPRQAANLNFLQNRNNPSPNGSQVPPNFNGTAPSQNPQQSLAERMRAGFAQAGFTDRDLQAQLLTRP